MNIGSLLTSSAASHPKNSVIVHGSLTLDYEQFNARVNRLSNALRRLGAQPSDTASDRSVRHKALISEIETIHEDRDMKNHGSPRVHRELQSQGHRVSANTIAKLMRDHGIRAASSRKFRVTTDSNHSHPVAENVLNREFEQTSANAV